MPQYRIYATLEIAVDIEAKGLKEAKEFVENELEDCVNSRAQLQDGLEIIDCEAEECA